MKKVSHISWGIALVAVGVVFALNSLDIVHINLFFDGWWTLFIIVPCAVGLFTEREKFGNLLGIAIGVCLLLCAQGVLNFSVLWKLMVPAVVVLLGLRLVWSGMRGDKGKELLTQQQANGKPIRTGFAAFSGCELKCDGEAFEGAELTAIFGGVNCDLKHAVIETDCAITATAVFGGIDILVPDTVNVQVRSVGIFGGTSNKTVARPDAPTVYVNTTCLFGGVDIK